MPLALKAVELSKTNRIELNTLGVAYYRLGDFTRAIETLESSAKAAGGGSAHDFFFLAMSYRRTGDALRAADSFAKAEKWLRRQSELILSRK